MRSSTCTIFLSLLAQIQLVYSFAPKNTHAITSLRRTTEQSSSVGMVPLDDVSVIYSASNFISTISADIDNIPQDNFAQVFAGGIFVMFGGVLSTVIVGFLLESGNSYASVVADSYAQGGNEEFWESLSPEDQEKTKELMEKLRKSKEGGDSGGDIVEKVPVAAISSDASSDDASPKNKTNEEISMFSDYD